MEAGSSSATTERSQAAKSLKKRRKDGQQLSIKVSPSQHGLEVTKMNKERYNERKRVAESRLQQKEKMHDDKMRLLETSLSAKTDAMKTRNKLSGERYKAEEIQAEAAERTRNREMIYNRLSAIAGEVSGMLSALSDPSLTEEIKGYYFKRLKSIEAEEVSLKAELQALRQYH